MQTYFKKLCSLNPKKYKFITFSEMEESYWYYCQCVIANIQKGSVGKYPVLKTVSEWLKTEI
jgi:hypothetical protein